MAALFLHRIIIFFQPLRFPSNDYARIHNHHLLCNDVLPYNSINDTNQQNRVYENQVLLYRLA